MPSTYTTRLRLTLPATGELTNAWGPVVNNGITELVDASIAGAATLSTWGGAGVAYTLSNNNGVADEARCMFIVASGSPGENKDIICPSVSKLYVVRNSVSGGFTVRLKTAAGTGITVPNGATMLLRCDGTNVVDAISHVSSLTLGAALPVGSGGTGATSLASKAVLIGNGTSAVTTVAPGALNNVLYSNGTDWVAGPLPSTSAVSSFSAGTTGFTPNTPSTGNVVLSGTLAVANGGTGQTTYTDGQLLIGNSTGNTLTKATLTAGIGIAITNGPGSITLASTAAGGAQDYIVQSYGIV